MILLNMKREDLAAVRPLWAAHGVGRPDKPGSDPGDRCLRPKAVVEVAEAAVVGPIVNVEPTGFADGFMWNVNEGRVKEDCFISGLCNWTREFYA